MAEVESNIVGFFTKAQPALDTKTGLAYPTGIISFQWDKVDDTARKLNGLFTCSVMGTAFNHGVDDDPTPGWENAAPMIQIRRASGGYTIRYYADDAWDDDAGESVAGWCAEDGMLDKETTVAVGGGFWMSTPLGDKTIYVTVKNPVK